MNSAYLLGRLGKNPETQTLSSGQTVTKFSVATSEKWKDKSGEKQEKTQWHNCTAWGKTGEVIAQYFEKGSPILITGKIEYRTWEKEDGTKGYATDIIVGGFEFVPSTKGAIEMKEEPAFDPAPELPSDEIPF